MTSWVESASGRLCDAGLSETSARSLMAAVAYSGVPLRAAFVPGRIELVGKHTDYAGGRSITCAVTHGFVVAVYAHPAPEVVVEDPAAETSMRFDLSGNATGSPAPWAIYPGTVLRWLAGNDCGPESGLRIRFHSNLAAAAGLSSSSAFSVGVLWATIRRGARVRDLAGDRRTLAALAGAVEMGAGFKGFEAVAGVGTRGGTQDHLAILCSEAGAWRQYRYDRNEPESAWPMPAGFSFVIGVSGVHAEKTRDALKAYNAASDSAAALARLWNERTGDTARHLADVFSRSQDAPDRLKEMINEPPFESWDSDLLGRRLAHFRLEFEEIVPGVGRALGQVDLPALGDVVDRSQRGAEQLLRNQVPETVHLAASARDLGASAASAFGAGFGGAVWAMIEDDRAEAFRNAWAAAYRERFPRRASASRFLLERAGSAAFSLTDAPFWP